MAQTLLVGLLISLIYAELTDISPGGLVTPVYIALYLHNPVRLLATGVIALLCLLVVRLLASFTILYGRRRFAVYLMVGIVLKLAFSFLYWQGLPFNLAVSVGYIVPGLLARDTERQGFVPTWLSLGITVCLVRLAMIVLPGVGL